MATTTERAPQTGTGSGGTTLRPRHIVETIHGKPADACLCGYVWDIYPVPYDEAAGICKKCIDEFARRECIGQVL